jgi:hypothetical protein
MICSWTNGIFFILDRRTHPVKLFIGSSHTTFKGVYSYTQTEANCTSNLQASKTALELYWKKGVLRSWPSIKRWKSVKNANHWNSDRLVCLEVVRQLKYNWDFLLLGFLQVPSSSSSSPFSVQHWGIRMTGIVNNDTIYHCSLKCDISIIKIG